MTLLDRVREGTAHEAARYLPLLVDGIRHGRVRRDHAARLAPTAAFVVTSDHVALREGLGDEPARTEAVEVALRGLGLDDWRGERLDVVPHWGGPVAFTVDRGAAPVLGIRGFGVHVNGLVRVGRDLEVWVGRRSADRRTSPGKLDHLVAGGIASGHGVMDTLVKEAHEEAGLPAPVARRAVPVSVITYRHDVALGLRDDALFVFDLDLPPDLVPRNLDGEVDRFERWPLGRVLETLRAGRAFKRNVALVLIDLLARRGLVGPEEPGYVEILSALRSGAEGSVVSTT